MAQEIGILINEMDNILKEKNDKERTFNLTKRRM